MQVKHTVWHRPHRPPKGDQETGIRSRNRLASRFRRPNVSRLSDFLSDTPLSGIYPLGGRRATPPEEGLL